MDANLNMVLDQVSKDKGIERKVLITALEEAILAAAKRTFGAERNLVATFNEEGYLRLVDRTKDVVKSGGEWISSVELENEIMAHPKVAMAACIGAKHPKWDERPLLVVVKKPGAAVTRDELLKVYDGKIAKWQIPDDVAFVAEIPHTATGKIQKLRLREQFKEHKLPSA